MTISADGSAPRARGTRRQGGHRRRRRRVSPACAGNTSRTHRGIGPPTGQPRVRGEHVTTMPAPRSCAGSAPRARGTPEESHKPLCACRVSPACAGNTSAPGTAAAWESGQPRVRGEHPGDGFRCRIPGGSAPRARGTHQPREQFRHCQRVSPACAGNTLCSSLADHFQPGQPRVRGEHFQRQAGNPLNHGSAPRARGTRERRRSCRRRCRVSPACAGNTKSGVHPGRSPPGQPRVRGEHSDRDGRSLGYAGSAPRARGTLEPRRRQAAQDRVSPACAGNTYICAVTTSIRPGQPRVRGEHSPTSKASATSTGSAPRARGTRVGAAVFCAAERVSPACAGNTARRAAAIVSSSGQPRVRGEHWTCRFTGGLASGSAPRARGTPDAHPGTQARKRVSPACAGTQKRAFVYRPVERVSPACAGNTFRALGRLYIGPGQPRVRGEHCPVAVSTRSSAGSAPRARGTHVARDFAQEQDRVSPACAGNTLSARRTGRLRSGQPRVRGEHAASFACITAAAGSAPRARGTPIP